MLFSLIGCTHNTDDSINEIENEETVFDPTNWGVTDSVTARNGELASVDIRLPYNTGILQDTGLIAVQNDSSVIIVDGQSKYDKLDNSIDEIFPYYFTNVKSILEAYYGSHASEYSLNVSKKEKTSINGYDMCVFHGSISMELYKKMVNYNWVAYATTLKSNGAYLYWMVFDYTDDQSMGDVIDDHAYKMAHTIEEYS